MNNWIEVSAERLTANFAAIQHAAGADTAVLAVIKANAYGHGAETCAPILVRAGAQWLGVTSAGEGARVRHALATAALDADILIMCGFLAEDVRLIAEHRLTPVVWTPEHIALLAALPGTRVHVEIDTGMGRQGVLPGPPLMELLARIQAAGLTLDGLFTHFCSAELDSAPVTTLQRMRFEEALSQSAKSGAKPVWIHTSNSSAVDNPSLDPAWLSRLADGLGARTLVRTGLALYGYSLLLPAELQPGRLHTSVLPVLTWNARVLAIRTLAAGDTVGYNATFTAARPMRIALLAVGYADGLRRELSSTNASPGGWVMLEGCRAPILGRISMNLTVVDVGEVPSAAADGTAIVLGDGMDADDHARLAHTIAYEILCGIHPCG